jgi:integrase
MQRGTIIKQRKAWTLVYYDRQVRGGSKKVVRVWKKLATISKEYPSAASVRLLADKILAPINDKRYPAEATLKVTEFIEKHYFPAMKSELRPSTYKGYKDFIYEAHIKARLGDIKLRDFRTVHAQRILRDITAGHRTLLHIKAFMSGVFKFAKQEGVLDGENPVKDSKVRGKPQKFQGVAYSVEEIDQLLEDVADPTANNVVTFLSFTGLRQSEARGVRWSDWDEPNRKLHIRRAVWQTRVAGTKNAASEDSIPVLPILRGMLEWRRSQVKPNPDDYIFAGKRRGSPLNFHNLENRVIKPALEKAKINGQASVEWKGFHGFRRGLASNLFALGVNPKVIAALLRHSDVSTTLQYYISVPESETRLAMEKLEARVLNPPLTGLIVNGRVVG